MSAESVAGSVAAPVVSPVRRRRNVLVWLSTAWILLVIVVTVFAGVLPFADYGVPVGLPRADPSGDFHQLLGLDGQGRSVLSRLVYGARVSLLVGVIAGTVATVIGMVLGLIAGYFRGIADTIIMYVTDALLAFPPLVLLLAISSILRPSFYTLLIGLTTLVIPTFARLARANTLNWASREFVLAARNMGWGPFRIAFREVLPNVIPSVLAYFPTVVAALIVAEGSLSFLGLGVPSPTPSWGSMIADGKDYLRTDPFLVFVPAAAIFLTVFALNQCGDYARHRFDRATRD
ncbi:ABC transporter permease [Amycolatopsis sp. GM8]|uniref:ABC transporter permease n=1 Tax=Amycolatopsis sp. GM8 TaxID=2896530 RepID=UPI001F2CB848|nr:ABC transporter permease [Amycolatopsis sp. GM8]